MLKNLKLFICGVGAVCVLLFGSTAFSAPVYPSFDGLMIPQTGCLPPAVNEEYRLTLMSDDTPQKPLTNQKLLTILIEFEDVKMHFSNQFWHDEMFDTTPGALSVVNYWKENANGVDVFAPADISSVVNGRTGTVDYEDYIDVRYTITKCSDGVVKVSLDMPHPIKTWNSDEETIPPPIPAEMAVYAIEQDLDFNVERPRIVTIFAGYEASTGNGAGKGQVHGYTPLVTMKTSDGTNLGFYTIQGELSYEDVSCGIGVICHEMGHSIFGLPDLYLTSHAALEDDGLGTYSLMADGSSGYRYNRLDNDNDYDNPYATYSAHVPAHLDPWCKIQCGFVTPTIVDEWDGNVNSIIDMGTDNKYNVIKVMSKVDPKQYFLIENRQLIGFDKGLEALNQRCYSGNTPFNGGILIYHVDENVGYNCNNTGKHMFISVEQSNRENPSLFHSFEWQYLNINGRNSLNAETIPNSNFHEADNLKICSYEEDCHPQTVKSGISIEVLSESSSSMRVKVNVDDEYKITETNETFSDIFKDINFCNAIIEMLSEDGKERKANDIISADDWLKILSIEILTISDRNIRSLYGIEHLSKLTDITCSNNELTELDFSNNPELNYIDCKNNKLVKLNISQCKNLMFLYCRDNALQELNIQSNIELIQLNCASNELKKLNVTQNTKLNRLICNGNYMDENYKIGIIGADNLKSSLVTSANNFKYSPQKTTEEKPTPSPTPTAEPSPTPKVEPSPTPIVSPTPTVEPSPTPIVSPSPTPTAEPSPSPALQTGDRVEFEQSGGKVTAKLIFDSTAPPAESDIMLIVAYSENGQLIRAEVPDITEMTAEFDYRDCDISVYVWDKNMKPLMEVQKLKKTAE